MTLCNGFYNLKNNIEMINIIDFLTIILTVFICIKTYFCVGKNFNNIADDAYITFSNNNKCIILTKENTI